MEEIRGFLRRFRELVSDGYVEGSGLVEVRAEAKGGMSARFVCERCL